MANLSISSALHSPVSRLPYNPVILSTTVLETRHMLNYTQHQYTGHTKSVNK